MLRFSFVIFLIGLFVSFAHTQQTELQEYAKDLNQLGKSSSQQGIDALIWASRQGYNDIVNAIIDRKIDVNGVSALNGNTALNGAIEFGHLETAKILVSRGAKVEQKGKQGMSALIYASARGDISIVKFLLEHGANVNSRAEFGHFTPLIIAVMEGHLEVVKLLVENGANLLAEDKTGKSALQIASQKRDVPMIDYLMKKIVAQKEKK